MLGNWCQGHEFDSPCGRNSFQSHLFSKNNKSTLVKEASDVLFLWSDVYEDHTFWLACLHQLNLHVHLMLLNDLSSYVSEGI